MFANTVVFSRVINGVPVIGAGSKIAIIFANNGKPVGFDFDWARYEQTGEKQATLGITELNARAAKLSAVDLKSPYTKITRLECGYFDFGARRRDPFAPLQTALRHAPAQKRNRRRRFVREGSDVGTHHRRVYASDPPRIKTRRRYEVAGSSDTTGYGRRTIR